jgi:hypothetical protein
VITSADEFVALRTSEDPREYRRAAHEAASIETWKDVIARFPDMRFWVAQNKTVPLEILELLATDPDSRVKHMVLGKGKVTPAILDILGRDQDEYIRAGVAGNTKTTAATLELLSHDGSHWVRATLAVRYGLVPSMNRPRTMQM